MSITPSHYQLTVTALQWLSADTFELRFDRPEGFSYEPGQKIGFRHQDVYRDYTLLGPPQAPELAICARRLDQGRFTPLLAAARPGDRFEVSAPSGYFTFQSASRPAVFIASGTGITPFVAFTRAGVRGFELLHGARAAAELYYSRELAPAARRYVPCLSAEPSARTYPLTFHGHVTQYLAQALPAGIYDFYLCGPGDMIREAIQIIDARFDGSRVFSELFY
ncbi:MAG: FAD-binding oxidoreductase [Desulfobacteraceae bacterium]|nr:FAD-binding oxidoreductase [Desulfobacteraceae bacterium]